MYSHGMFHDRCVVYMIKKINVKKIIFAQNVILFSVLYMYLPVGVSGQN